MEPALTQLGCQCGTLIPHQSVWGQDSASGAPWDQPPPLELGSPNRSGNQDGRGAAKHTLYSVLWGQAKVIKSPSQSETPLPLAPSNKLQSWGLNCAYGSFLGQIPEAEGLFLRTSSLLFSAFLIRNNCNSARSALEA